MKIKVWIRVTDLGDGSRSFRGYHSEELAGEGIDEDGFGEDPETHCEVDYVIIDTDLCERVE